MLYLFQASNKQIQALKFKRHCNIVYSFSHNHESGNCICKRTTDWCFSSIIMGGRGLENRGHHKRFIFFLETTVLQVSSMFQKIRAGIFFWYGPYHPHTIYAIIRYTNHDICSIFLGCDECNLNTPYLEWVVPPPTHFVTSFHLPGERHFGSQPLCPSGKKTCTTLWWWDDLDVI